MATWNDFTFALPKRIQKEHWEQEKNKKECKTETAKEVDRKKVRENVLIIIHGKLFARKFIILSSVWEENIHILECTRNEKKMEWKETKRNKTKHWGTNRWTSNEMNGKAVTTKPYNSCICCTFNTKRHLRMALFFSNRNFCVLLLLLVPSIHSLLFGCYTPLSLCK